MGDPGRHLDRYHYRGARAMVILHERHLRGFVSAWRRLVAAGVTLPETSDPDYGAPTALLRHVLGAARGYMVWMARQLGLGDPGIDPVPPLAEIEDRADAYLEHVLERWRSPLRDVPAERFEDGTHTSNWGVEYSIDAMLEHAVMHPIRHAFQLEELLDGPAPESR